MNRAIQPVIAVTDENLIITLPLSQITAFAEADEYSQVEITDKTVFAAYLARHLQNPKRHEEDVTELIADNIRAVFDDAIYVGAGIRSRLEDIPHLIDRMWQNHKKILTRIYEGHPRGMTAHGCLIEAIRAARKGDFQSAAGWLDHGQGLNEDVAQSLLQNIEEAMTYAIATYGSESNGTTDSKM